MGNQQSTFKITEYARQYNQMPVKDHHFFGTHRLLLLKKDNKKGVICKNMFFHSDSEYQEFMLQYQSVDRKPFSLVYPRDVIDSPRSQQCTVSKEVMIYFDVIGEPLSCQVESQGVFSEAKGWFLLNQLSKSLEVMEEHGHSHLAISPQTVYCNNHGNYLLYDSFFVLGREPTSFLKEAKVQRFPLTARMSKILDRHSYPSRQEAKEQDMYTVGLTLFFALTGVNPKVLPLEPARSTAAEEIINGLKVSRQMKHMLTSLIDSVGFSRMDNNQLRRLLKDKEVFIMKKQRMQFINSNQNSRFSLNYSNAPQDRSSMKSRQGQGRVMESAHSPKLSINPSQTSIYLSRQPSMKDSAQLSISDNRSHQNFPSSNRLSSKLVRSYRPLPSPAKQVIIPQGSQYLSAEGQYLTRVRSQETLRRW